MRSSFLAVCMLLISSTSFAQFCGSGINSHLQFDGSDDTVRVPAHAPAPAALDGFQSFTLEAWVKKGGVATLTTIVSKGAPPGSRTFHLGGEGTSASGWFPRLALNYPTAYGQFSGTTAIPFGGWHHVAATRDINTAQVRLLVDGVLTNTFSYPQPLNSQPGNIIEIGGQAAGFHLDGSIDEVRIWNVARTDAQILQSMAQVLIGNEPGLVGYWRFDEGGGQTVHNLASSTGSAADGVIGSSVAPASDDPTWVSSNALSSPICYSPVSTVGWHNSPQASLVINGAGAGTLNGPFLITIPTTGPNAYQLDLTWSGPIGASYVLAGGSLSTSPFGLGTSGSLDLNPLSLIIVFDGTTFPGLLFFNLGPNGTASQTYFLPPGLTPGFMVSVQGAVIQSGFSQPFVMTAAFQISI